VIFLSQDHGADRVFLFIGYQERKLKNSYNKQLFLTMHDFIILMAQYRQDRVTFGTGVTAIFMAAEGISAGSGCATNAALKYTRVDGPVAKTP